MRDKIISIILIVLGIFLIGYGSIESMNINNKKIKKENDENNSSISRNLGIIDLNNYELVDININEVTDDEKLLSIVPLGIDGYFSKCIGLNYSYTTFESTKVTINEVPFENLFKSVFRYLNQIGDFTQGKFNEYTGKTNATIGDNTGKYVYEVSFVKDMIKKMYGASVSSLPEEIRENNNEKYNLSIDNLNYYGYYESFDCNESNVYNEYFNSNGNSYVEYYDIVNREDNDGILSLFVKVIPVEIVSENFLIDETTKFNIYKYGHSLESDMKKEEFIVKQLDLVNTFKQDTSYEVISEAKKENKKVVNSKDFKEQLFDNYGDLATIYKVSFEKSSDDFYKWISTEPVE